MVEDIKQYQGGKAKTCAKNERMLPERLSLQTYIYNLITPSKDATQAAQGPGGPNNFSGLGTGFLPNPCNGSSRSISSGQPTR
jgi:hypothetical protein